MSLFFLKKMKKGVFIREGVYKRMKKEHKYHGSLMTLLSDYCYDMTNGHINKEFHPVCAHPCETDKVHI